jgi:2-polyprenyl-3-methyl-5-hydroxy-6-metoxy-1,4-benzoquinol methylase
VEYGTTSERFDYFLCPDCDCLSISPLPSDRLEQIYPPTYYSFASAEPSSEGLVERVKARLDSRMFRKALAAIGKPDPRILDVGGGTGEISAGFVRETDGRAVATVVDIDPKSIEAARARGLQGFVGRIEDFESDEHFDLILMLNLVEHVADPLAVLASARERLAPDGILWL